MCGGIICRGSCWIDTVRPRRRYYVSRRGYVKWLARKSPMPPYSRKRVRAYGGYVPYGVRPKAKRPRYAYSASTWMANRKAAQTAKRVSLNPRIGGYVGLELKYVDYVYSASVANGVAGSEADPATALCLNVAAQGDGPNQRDGRRCVTKSYEVRGGVYLDALASQSTAPLGRNVRLMLIKDKQTNGAQFNAEDVLVDASGNDVFSLINLEYRERFEILEDITVPLDYTVSFNDTGATGGGVVSGNYKPFIWKGTLNMPTTSPSGQTTAAIAAVADNSLHVIAIASTTGVTLSYHSRCRFVG